MMIQSAPAGEPRFVTFMVEHNELCEQFVRAFGNDDFEPCEPADEMIYVVGHHDYGWVPFDEKPVLDAKSRFPAGIGSGPVPGALGTSSGSPDYNEKRHAYCGLLSSMHTWGLYNARYGYSNFLVRKDGGPSVPIEAGLETETHAMLDAELERQNRLKDILAGDPETAAWIEDKHLMQNYKQLQFFDTLALYFHLRHETEREEETYLHVPKSADEDATVTLTPRGDGTYALSPFPFAGDRLEVACKGRYVDAAPEGEDADVGALLTSLPTTTQVHTLVRG